MSIEATSRNSQIIRAATSITYDAQASRVSTGNRIVAAVKLANGMIDTTPKKLRAETEEDDKEKNRFIVILQNEYKILSEKCTSKQFLNETSFKKMLDQCPEVQYMKDVFSYHMMGVYNTQLETEATLIKTVSQMVKEHPIWDSFLKDVTGCGPLMAAVCISYLDPYKARHASSFWRYAGLDVVYEPYDNKQKDCVYTNEDEIDPNDPVGSAERGGMKVTPAAMDYFTKHVRVEWDDGREVYEADVFDAQAMDDAIVISTVGAKFSLPMKEKDTVTKPTKRNGLTEPVITPGAKIIDFDIIDLDSPIPVPDGREVGRSRRHLVDVEYIDKEGNTRTKKSISYNPTLKTKLVGVLADSFLKCPGSKYEQIYRNYRHRLDNSARHVGKSNAHKHMMAKRYCVKMFLQDLWVAWRTIEGLPVTEPYAVQYLGKNPHGFNYDPDAIQG